jgi:ABC-type dipeptide/oligopeptide/nickel transport system ATPase component
MLEVADLVIEFDTSAGRRRVVDGVSFSVQQGEVLGILGESGSGKTLSTLAVLGLVPGRPGVISGRIDLTLDDSRESLLADLPSVVSTPSRGPVRKDDRRWNRLVQRRWRPLWGRVMTAVFQNPRQSLDPLMTIGAQLDESVRLASPGQSRYASYAHELSGGMCQRAMIAIALARQPRLLIADEPTTGLDTTVRQEIVELFQELLAAERRAMMYISHDIREVLFLAREIIVMRHGRIVEVVSAEDLKNGQGRRHPYTATLLAAADLPVGEVAS